MATKKAYVVVCDSCETDYDDGYGWFWDLGSARAEAQMDGWSVAMADGDLDLCSDCAEAQLSVTSPAGPRWAMHERGPVARIRSIKPEFWTDQDLARLPRDVRMLYIALWNFADEEGRMPGDPRLVKSWCFPLDDDVTAEVIDRWLDVLAGSEKVIRYEVEGSSYLYLLRLHTHQKLDKRLRSRHPAPPPLRPAETPSYTDATPIHADQSGRTGVPNADVTPTEQVAGSRWQVAGSRVRETNSSSSSSATKQNRNDVERLCAHLADRIEANGCKRPTIGTRWHDAARLMIDTDGHTEEQIHRAIDWCQDDEFWRGVVMSMPKLRQRYDQMRLQAGRAATGRRRSTTDQRVAAALELANRYPEDEP